MVTMFGSAEIRVRIIVTKIDAYDPDIIGEHVKKTYHSARLHTLMEVRLPCWKRAADGVPFRCMQNMFEMLFAGYAFMLCV